MRRVRGGCSGHTLCIHVQSAFVHESGAKVPEGFILRVHDHDHDLRPVRLHGEHAGPPRPSDLLLLRRGSLGAFPGLALLAFTSSPSRLGRQRQPKEHREGNQHKDANQRAHANLSLIPVRLCVPGVSGDASENLRARGDGGRGCDVSGWRGRGGRTSRTRPKTKVLFSIRDGWKNLATTHLLAQPERLFARAVTGAAAGILRQPPLTTPLDLFGSRMILGIAVRSAVPARYVVQKPAGHRRLKDAHPGSWSNPTRAIYRRAATVRDTVGPVCRPRDRIAIRKRRIRARSAPAGSRARPGRWRAPSLASVLWHLVKARRSI